jgi:two-component system chemotaxis response regulator CheB
VAHRDIVVGGASAGGVEALRDLVAGLPPALPTAVLVVLHMPASSSGTLARILERPSRLPVRRAVEGDALFRSAAQVAGQRGPGTPKTTPGCRSR